MAVVPSVELTRQLTPDPGAGGEPSLYSTEQWEALPRGVEIIHVRPTIQRPRVVAQFETALRLWLHSCRNSSVGLVEMKRATLMFCLLRSFLPTKGRVILYPLYLQRSGRLKTALLRRALKAATVCVVWSDREGDRCSAALRLPRQHLVTMRYKPNHAKFGHLERLALGDFIFSGGNSERDYRTLFEAVRGMSIPVVVSRTDESLTAGCEVPKNVLIVKTGELDFAQLMASARLVVVPLTAGRLRGAGETSCLDAMWHGRPVICADDLAAAEYVESGVDGVVVPPGNPDQLRKAILTLWHDHEKAEAMGKAGLQKVRAGYMPGHFATRMLALAGVGALPMGCPPLTRAKAP